MLDNQDLQTIQSMIDASESRMKAYFESAFMPKFDLLLEGHNTIMETMAPKTRVDALEDEIIFLKQVIKSISQEVQELKKAQ